MHFVKWVFSARAWDGVGHFCSVQLITVNTAENSKLKNVCIVLHNTQYSILQEQLLDNTRLSSLWLLRNVDFPHTKMEALPPLKLASKVTKNQLYVIYYRDGISGSIQRIIWYPEGISVSRVHIWYPEGLLMGFPVIGTSLPDYATLWLTVWAKTRTHNFNHFWISMGYVYDIDYRLNE